MIERKDTTDTSSIGPQWPPKESSFNRVKGIYNRSVIRDHQVFLGILDEVDVFRQNYVDCEGNIDRLSVRVVVDNKVLFQEPTLLEKLGEVIIPLNGTNPDFENTSLVYLGYNSEQRKSDSEDLQRALGNVENAIITRTVSFEEAIKRVSDQGFFVSTLDNTNRLKNENFQEQMARLYQRFGWSKNEVLDILSNSSNIISVAFAGQQVVSAGIAETNIIRFEDGAELRIAEITEAATDVEFQSKGLYSAVAANLMFELATLSADGRIYGGGIDLIFGECNGNELGVLKAVKSLGRTFAIEASRASGLPFKGYLPQHVPIAGAERKTPYNDLFPAYITRETLMRLSNK